MAVKAFKLAAVVIGAVVGLAACLVAYVYFLPFARVAIPLPMGAAVAFAEKWTDFGENPMILVVRTPFGSASHPLWHDWGPADRINLYRTSDDWLVALGGGGAAEMFEVRAMWPRWVPYRERPQSGSESWIYLGAVDNDYVKRTWRFFPPAERSECFAMLGAGSSPYRVRHQTEHSCH